jgi:hypothetical protein
MVLYINYRDIVKNIIEVEVEVDLPFRGEGWELKKSVWVDRCSAKSSDSRHFWDSHECLMKCFIKDWNMIKVLPRVHQLITRADEEVLNKTQTWEQELEEIEHVLKEDYPRLFNVFRHYSGLDGERGQAFTIQENKFKKFVHDCDLINSGSNSEAYDQMFIAVNFEADKKSADSIANDDRSFMRFEWLEAVIRMSIIRWGQICPDVSDCVKLFVSKSLQRIEPIEICDQSPNHFRNKRMLNHKIDELLRSNLTVLKAVFEFYRGSADNKRAMAETMDMKDWNKMIIDLNLTEMGLSLVYQLHFHSE